MDMDKNTNDRKDSETQGDSIDDESSTDSGFSDLSSSQLKDYKRNNSINSKSLEESHLNNKHHCHQKERKSSKTWSPNDFGRESTSNSSSSSDSNSSRSDIILRALQTLHLVDNEKEKKRTKKSPKRILRQPITYTYVKGLSGLPTQRVPQKESYNLYNRRSSNSER